MDLLDSYCQKGLPLMRCKNFFSAAIRQGSGAWLLLPDNNSWICLFFTPVALSCQHLFFPVHPTPSLLPLPFLFIFSPSLLLSLCLPQRFVQPTVVAMASVCRAPAAATTAGRAQGVTRGRVTLAATSTAHARTANVNAALAGMENTAPLVGRQVVWVEGGFEGRGLSVYWVWG